MERLTKKKRRDDRSFLIQRANWDMIDKEKYEELSTIVLKNVESQLSGDVPWDVRVKSLLDGLHGAAIKSLNFMKKKTIKGMKD